MTLITIKPKHSVLEADIKFETYPENAIQDFDNATPITEYKEEWRIYKNEVIDSTPHIEPSEKEKSSFLYHGRFFNGSSHCG